MMTTAQNKAVSVARLKVTPVIRRALLQQRRVSILVGVQDCQCRAAHFAVAYLEELSSLRVACPGSSRRHWYMKAADLHPCTEVNEKLTSESIMCCSSNSSWKQSIQDRLAIQKDCPRERTLRVFRNRSAPCLIQSATAQ